MTITALFAGNPDNWTVYDRHLRVAFAEQGLDVDLLRETDDPASVDYIILNPKGPISDFSPFVNAKAVLNLWAGVETLTGNTTLTQTLCRMVDPGMTEGMQEWVTGHAMRYHLGMDTHILGQAEGWRAGFVPTLARDRKVGVLGLGALGMACAGMLASLRFDVLGWSRSAKTSDIIRCHSGKDGLRKVLSEAEILVLLMPYTADTENILNAEHISWMPRGARIINPGRGQLIDDSALIAALDSGQIGHATLDVFRIEPLPDDHPYWAHPGVTVTPHCASETRPKSASRSIAENMRRGEDGLPFLNIVDRVHGY